MRHTQPTGEQLELAAGYALDVLDPEQAASFESHLAEGCGVCEREVKAFAEATGYLSYATAAEAPRPEVRTRLLARIRSEAAVAAGQAAWTVVGSIAGEWEAAGLEGLRIKRLFVDPVEQRQTILGRMAAGVHYPSHRHAGTEELYVLDGDLTMGGEALHAGDYCAATAGSIHSEVSTIGGCVFLLSASERDEVVEESGPAGPQTGVTIIRSTDGAWREGSNEGVAIKRLFSEPAQGNVTGLVRVRGGTRCPGHLPVAGEQFYTLEGSAHLAGHLLEAGDYMRATAPVTPASLYTEDGCMFLMLSAPPELFS